MLDDLKALSSVKKEFLSFEHSLGENPKTSLRDVRVFLLSPHDSGDKDNVLGVRSFPDEVMAQLPFDPQLLKAYLESERDAGINELRRGILERCNGALSVSSELNRGLCNLNKEDGGQLPNIWMPEARRVVEPRLQEMHAEALGDIDRILAALRKDVKIICLHSMDPWSFKDGARPKLSPETLRQYVEAQGLPEDKKTPRKEDFITGQQGKAVIADKEMYRVMKKLFDQRGIAWAINAPYDTEPGYPDWRYMKAFPRRVSAVDFTKTSLCEGTYATFDPRNPTVDSSRVELMAELYKIAINRFTGAPDRN